MIWEVAAINKNYDALNDNTLSALTKNGDGAAFEEITIRYIKLIFSLASKYKIDGYDTEDLAQEGLLAFLIACKSYDEQGGASFKNYAVKCAKNRFNDLSKKSKKKSSVPDSKLVELDKIGNTEDELNVEEYVLEKEYLKTMLTHLDNLLNIDERKVFRMYAHGYSYNEIAEEIDSTPKNVDNILQKIKRKLRG